MNSFVRSKNAASHDDLKMRVPNMKVAMEPSRGGDRGRSAGAPDERRHRSDTRAFYDTDSSKADSISIASAAPTAHVGVEREGRADSHSSGPHGFKDEDEYEVSSDDDSEEDLNPDPLHGVHGLTGPGNRDVTLNSEQRHKMGMIDSLRKGHHKSITEKYVQGDSYPSTTSGRLSVSDTGERMPSPYGFPPQHHPVRPSHIISSAPEVPLTQTRHQVSAQPAKKGPGLQQQQHGALFENPTHKELEPGVEAANTFKMARALAPTPPPQQVQQQMMFPVATQNDSHLKNAAQNRSGAHQSQHLPLPQQQHQRQGLPVKPIEKRQKPHEERQDQLQFRPKSVEVFEADIRDGNDGPTRLATHGPTPAREQKAEPETELDYQPHELYCLKYDDVKDAVFDSAPRSVPFKLPEHLPNMTLSEQLSSAARLSSDQQVSFFASLQMDAWEEAGDWFLDRFGELVSRFKTARQEKRKAARTFEDEIEKRHEAISKKRKVTEDALGEMKINGALILQGTPRKARKPS